MLLSMSSLLCVVVHASAGFANPLQIEDHSFVQQTENHLKDEDESTPKQGLPGRRVSGGTRNTQTFKPNQIGLGQSFYLKAN